MKKFDCVKILQYLEYDPQKALPRLKRSSGIRGADIFLTGFKRMVEQANTCPHIDFKGNLLILSDRLYGAAVGIHYFMRKCTSANVTVTYDRWDALAAAENAEFDYLVIAGYLRYKSGYEIIPMLRKRENPPAIVMWAQPDSLIQSICAEHNIFYVFDRWKPVGEFVEFLRGIKA